jgi:hypothetical protein
LQSSLASLSRFDEQTNNRVVAISVRPGLDCLFDCYLIRAPQSRPAHFLPDGRAGGGGGKNCPARRAAEFLRKFCTELMDHLHPSFIP